MKKIYNNIIPLKGFMAMTVWPFIFIRNEYAWTFDTTKERHENIHGMQQIEMLLVFFLLWYGIEWCVRWVAYGFDGQLAYMNISFEQEAYLNENDMSYTHERKLYSFVRYLFKKSYVRDDISRKIVKNNKKNDKKFVVLKIICYFCIVITIFKNTYFDWRYGR